MLRIHRTKLSQSKFSRMSWLGLAGTVSCCALVLVFGLMLFPTLPQEVQAIDFTDPPSGTTTTDPSTGTSVGISLPASIDFDSVTPAPNGATTTATADLTVTTTNSASYSLYLYSSDGDNSLRPKIPANTSSIIATAGGVGLTLSSLEPNTWGYNLGTSAPTDTTTYSAVPANNSTPIQTKDTSDTNSANDTYTLSFGAKVDTSIPSGAYFNTLTIAVVAEPKRLSSELPDGIDPDIFTATNPAVIDIYPTTGWEGDVIAITSDGQFNDIVAVTIGGTSCESYQVVNEYLIACKLPSKAASSTGYNVAVATASKNIDMHNLTVRYFDPARTENVGSNTTTNVTMQMFTADNCNAMNIGQIVSLTDDRNGQTYRIKKMADNKCWMIDDLKYLGEGLSIPNVDGTNGIIYNNETGRYNTVDGTDTQSTANIDKAFYNNPMSSEICYGSSPVTDFNTSITDSYTRCGYLYNWHSITAGTGTYTLENYAPESICPAGWVDPHNQYNTLDGILDEDWASFNPVGIGSWSNGLSISSSPRYTIGYAFGNSRGMYNRNFYLYTYGLSYGQSLKNEGSAFRCILDA